MSRGRSDASSRSWPPRRTTWALRSPRLADPAVGGVIPRESLRAGPSRKPNLYRHCRPAAGLVEKKQEMVSRKGGSVDSPGGGGLCGTLWR